MTDSRTTKQRLAHLEAKLDRCLTILADQLEASDFESSCRMPVRARDPRCFMCGVKGGHEDWCSRK